MDKGKPWQFPGITMNLVSEFEKYYVPKIKGICDGAFMPLAQVFRNIKQVGPCIGAYDKCLHVYFSRPFCRLPRMTKTIEVQAESTTNRYISVDEQFKTIKEFKICIGYEWHNIVRLYQIINGSWKVEAATIIEGGIIEEKKLSGQLLDSSNVLYYPMINQPQVIPLAVRIKIDISEAFLPGEGMSLFHFILVVRDTAVFEELGSDVFKRKMMLTMQDGYTQVSCCLLYFSYAEKKMILGCTLPKVFFGIDNALFLYADQSMEDNPRIGIEQETHAVESWFPYAFAFHAVPAESGAIPNYAGEQDNYNIVNLAEEDYSTGVYGSSLVFSQAHVTYADIAQVDNLSGFTLEILFQSEPWTGTSTIIMKGDEAVAGWSVKLHADNNGFIFTCTEDGNYIEWFFDNVSTVSIWQFVAFAFIRGGDPVLFKNGVKYLHNNKVVTVNALATTADGQHPLTLGAMKSGAGWDQYFDGKIESVYITPFVRTDNWLISKTNIVQSDVDVFQDILLNPGFEDGTANWTGTAVINTAFVKNGINSAYMDTPGALMQTITVEPGRYYAVSAWVYCSGSAVIRIIDGVDEIKSVSNKQTGMWEYLQIKCIAQSASIEIGIMLITGAVYIDRIEIGKTEPNLLVNHQFQYNDFMKKVWQEPCAQINNIMLVKQQPISGIAHALITKDLSEDGFTLQKVHNLIPGDIYKVDFTACKTGDELGTVRFFFGTIDQIANENGLSYARYIISEAPLWDSAWFEAIEPAMLIGFKIEGPGELILDSVFLSHIGAYENKTAQYCYNPLYASSNTSPVEVFDISYSNANEHPNRYDLGLYGEGSFSRAYLTPEFSVSNSDNVKLTMEFKGTGVYSVQIFSSSMGQGFFITNEEETMPTNWTTITREQQSTLTATDARVLLIIHEGIINILSVVVGVN